MKGLLAPVLIGLAGIAALLLLFPRFDPSAHIGSAIDRDLAIARTRQFAASKGVDTNGWRTRVAELLDLPTGPLRIRVELHAPNGDRHLDTVWLPDGRMDSSRLPDEPEAPRHEAVHVDTTDSDGGHVNVRVDDRIKEPQKLAYLPLRIFEGLWRAAVLVYFIVAAIRRRVRYRVALILTVVMLLSVSAEFWGGSGYQKTRMLDNVDVNEQTHFGSVFWIFVFTAAGFSVRGAGNRAKWSSLELAATGGFFDRKAGRSVAAGLATGIGVAAIPYLIAATGIFRGVPLIFRSMEMLAAPFPAAAAWALWPALQAVGLFGLSIPLAARVERRWLRWGLIALLGVAVLGVELGPFSKPGPNLVTAALVFGAYLWLYLRTDLLAVIAAMVSAHAVLAPAVLLAAPNGTVRALAIPLLSIWVVALAGSFRLAVRGREGVDLPATPSLEPIEERETKSGRMRLEAEFEVARKAQEAALPGAAPSLAGYSLAGSCQPARQVGGDLYDFFPLSDGRLGIAVADVSGKGVPAALYMMVTKGLLAAITRESSDLAYILGQINQHLYRACRKKVFVTLAAVALDAPRRRLQHGRAGHNPILWRRAARGETVILKPAGLALGMTPGDRFNRLLRIEELELEPGDAIVLYSDGITEAVDATLEQFGDNRLIHAVEATDGQPADESRVAILRELADFVGTTPARDDITLVVLRVAENSVLI